MTIHWNDALNALIELGGGAMVWWNVYRLYLDKSLKGIAWQSQAWGLLWNVWHLIYYPTLSQWCSFGGELFGAAAVVTWLGLAWRYRRG